MELGEKIKGLREDRDLYQKDIASILKTTQSYYAQYENGKRQIPIHHLKTLCLFYDLSADYLLNLPTTLKDPRKRK